MSDFRLGEESRIPFETPVLAVWPGQHATDLFEINPDKYIPIMELRVKRLEKMKFNELKELEWRERYGIK